MSVGCATRGDRVSLRGRVARAACAALLTVLVVAAGAAVPDSAAAQAVRGASIEIVRAEHDPAGAVTIAIRTDGGRKTELQSLTVFIDDAPVTLDVASRAVRRDLAVVLLIDVSGSMAGAPLDAARGAARELIRRLPPTDRIGLVAFASGATVRAGLSTDRAGLLAKLDGLRAEGSTALYAAVATGVAQLADVVEGERVLVLLSDGQDSSDVSTIGREESVATARAGRAAVYAVGAGAEYDEAYLSGLAAASAGQFFGMRNAQDAQALNSLFAQLGDRFSASETYRVPVETLTEGSHRIAVRALVNGASVSATAMFPVTNTGLLRPEVRYPDVPGQPIGVLLGPGVEHQDLTFEARIGGRTFAPVGQPTLILVDPWSLTPGTHEVQIAALARGGIARRETLRIEVPVLAPTIEMAERDGATVIRGMLQGQPRPELVARSGSSEVARGTGEISLRPEKLPIVVELLDAAGATVLTREVSRPVGASASTGLIAAGVAVAAVLLALVAGLWWRARRRRATSERQILRRVAKETQAPAALAWADEPVAPTPHLASSEEAFGLLVVYGTNGFQRQVSITHRPITVGSAADCGVVLDDPEVRARHIRISALSADEVQVHVLGEDGVRPYLQHEDDEWLIVRHGEQLSLGSHRLQVIMTRGEEGLAATFDGPEIYSEDSA